MDTITILRGTILIIMLIGLPGISMTMALFPRREELDIVERVGLGFVLGLTPQFVLYFASKNFYLPINTLTTSLTILLISLAGIAIWQFRRRQIYVA